jgi:hypothetical protein
VNDIGLHIGLFVLIGLGIVLFAAFHSESDDARALLGVPRRLAWFVAGCGILALFLIVAQLTVASVH